MPSSRKSNDLRAQVAACNEAFKAVETSVSEFETAEATTRQRLYVALERLFDFCEATRSNVPTLKAFVVGRKGKWGKIAEENPFQPLVKIAFPRAHEASQSQYAKVLAFAHDQKEKGELKASLAKWLADYPGGLDGAYKAATDHFMTPSRKRTLEEIRSQQLAAARQVLSTRMLSTAFRLSEPLDDIQNGFVMALVRVTDGAEAMIVDVVEKDQERLEADLLRFADPIESEMDVLGRKPLFPLFRAVDLLLGTANTGSRGNNLSLLIQTPKGNKGTCRIFSASTDYSFVWGQVELSSGLPKLPRGATFSLSRAQAEAFVRDFRTDGEFSLLPPPAGKADFRLSSSGANTGEASLIPFVPEGTKLRVGRLPAERKSPMLLRHEVIGRFVKWHDTLKRSLAKGAAKGGPKRLDLTWESGKVTVTPTGMVGASLDLMEMRENPGFQTERWLALDDLRRLCDAVLPYGVDLHGWLIDGDIPQAAFLFEHDFGDRFQVLMPLVMSADMHYALTCEDLNELSPA